MNTESLEKRILPNVLFGMGGIGFINNDKFAIVRTSIGWCVHVPNKYRHLMASKQVIVDLATFDDACRHTAFLIKTLSKEYDEQESERLAILYGS